MIDTLRFKIYIDDETRACIERNSTEKKEIHPEYGCKTKTALEENVDYRKRCFYSKVFISGVGYGFRVSLYGSNLFVEFSAPKVIFGSNIFMLYPEGIPEVLNKVKANVDLYYGIKLPEPVNWVLQRLDICYAWRFPSEEMAQKVLVVLSSYEFPRKKKTIIGNESLTYWGTTCKVKFYLKRAEYKTHSMGRHKKNTYAHDNSHKMLEACNGIVRFEVTMFKKKVQQVFGEEETCYTRLTYEIVENLLKQHLSELVKTDNFKSMDLMGVYDKLETAYGKKQALNLFQFYVTWFCENKTQERLNRLLLDNRMCTSTIKKRLDFLEGAGVGIINTVDGFDFDLTVPSAIAVNSLSDNVVELLPAPEYPKKKFGGVKD